MRDLIFSQIIIIIFSHALKDLIRSTRYVQQSREIHVHTTRYFQIFSNIFCRAEGRLRSIEKKIGFPIVHRDVENFPLVSYIKFIYIYM